MLSTTHAFLVHYSLSTTFSGNPSGSTLSPSSSSQPKSKESGSKSSPNTQQSKKGRASNQRGGTLSDRLSPDDHNQESKSDNASSQTKIEKEKTHIAFKQELHLSQELPSSTSSKIPPDKAVNKRRPLVSSNELSLTSPGGPGTAETQPQTPPALLHIEVAGQPKAKPHGHQNTATIFEITQHLPSAIHDKAANQLCSSFNVKPPPDAQVSHGAEINSGVLHEAEWNESATKSSASVNTFADTVREYAPDSEFSVAPAVQLSDKKPPSDESSHIQAVPEEINEDTTSNKPIPVTKSPSSEGLVGAPASSTIDPEALPADCQPSLGNHSLLEFLDGESVDEFSPLHFNSSAGDDGFVQLRVNKYTILSCISSCPLA